MVCDDMNVYSFLLRVCRENEWMHELKWQSVPSTPSTNNVFKNTKLQSIVCTAGRKGSRGPVQSSVVNERHVLSMEQPWGLPMDRKPWPWGVWLACEDVDGGEPCGNRVCRAKVQSQTYWYCRGWIERRLDLTRELGRLQGVDFSTVVASLLDCLMAWLIDSIDWTWCLFCCLVTVVSENENGFVFRDFRTFCGENREVNQQKNPVSWVSGFLFCSFLRSQSSM